MSDISIRKATKEDYPFILRINDENVEVLSPMNEAKLISFAENAELLLVAESDGKPAAFLIALREGVDSYKSENYKWFCKHYERFLYIDRIVIDKPFRHAGIGKGLYGYVFEHAKKAGVEHVTAEVDTIPYNAISLAFHAKMGFREVGVQFVRDNAVKVSLQEKEVSSWNCQKHC